MAAAVACGVWLGLFIMISRTCPGIKTERQHAGHGGVGGRGGPPRYHATFHLRRREDQSRSGGEEGGLNRMRTKIVFRDHPSDRTSGEEITFYRRNCSKGPSRRKSAPDCGAAACPQGAIVTRERGKEKEMIEAKSESE